MAVIISNGAGNLSASNAFYRVEAHNLSGYSTSRTTVSTTPTNLPITFANAGNCQGVVLGIEISSDTIDRNIIVKLQQNIASVWVDTLSTITVSAATLTNGVTNKSGSYIIPFIFATSTLITTASSTWRFQIIESGGTTGTYRLATSTAGSPMYATWCNNAVSFTNDDTLICKDIITIDQSFSVGSVLGTGDTTNGICAILCRSANPTSGNQAMLQLLTPAASYTMTLKGIMVLSAQSAFRAGTASTPIPYAQKFTIVQDVPNAGTQSKFISHFNSPNVGKISLYLFGESFTNEATLSGILNVGATSLTTTASSGWEIGDTFSIGRGDSNSTMDNANLYTITSISGTSINFSPSLAAIRRLNGAPILRTNGRGIVLKNNNTIYNYRNDLQLASNFQVDGVEVIKSTWGLGGSGLVSSEDAANKSKWFLKNCSYLNDNAFGRFIAESRVPAEGFLIEKNLVRGQLIFTDFGGVSSVVNYEMKDNIFVVAGRVSFFLNANMLFHGNRIENCNDIPFIFATVTGSFKNNAYFGCNAAMAFSTLINTSDISGNVFNKCNSIYTFFSTATVINSSCSGDTSGTLEGTTNNAINISNGAGYIDFEFRDTVGAFLPNIATVLPTILVGSKLRFSNYNSVANDDRTYQKYGLTQRTGFGLTDTTVRTGGSTFGSASAGQFALRFEPSSSLFPLTFEQRYPTGNIQNKTMTVAVWCKINNASFYSGTHIKPTLKVIYDNNSVVTKVADGHTNGQLLSVTFTPTTQNGDIQIILEVATSATGSNAYVYFDDLTPINPSGHIIDTTNFSQFSGGLPVLPSISTFPSLGSIWDEATSAHTIAGSFGQLIKDTEIKVDDTFCLGVAK